MKLTTLLVIAGLLAGTLAHAQVLPRVAVNAADIQADENGLRPGVFTITRTGATNNPLLVIYRMDGSAVNGIDYRELPGQVIIPAGASKVALELSPIDDGIAETVEHARLVLQPGRPAISVTPSLYEIGSPSNAIVSISSNDADTAILPGVTLSVRSQVVPEPGSLVFLLQRFGPGQNRALRVEYEVIREGLNAEGFEGVPLGAGQSIGQIPPATPGSDYPGLSGVVEFPAGAASVLVTAPVLDDQFGEGTEHVTIRLKPANSFQINAPGRATIFVQDNDPNGLSERAVVSLRAMDAEASESGANPGAFLVTRSGLTNVTLTVLYTVSGTASNGVDYTRLPSSVVIPAGVATVELPVRPLADQLNEPTETVVITLQTPVCIAIFPPPPECYLVSPSSEATVRIANVAAVTNRAPTVAITSPTNGAVLVGASGQFNSTVRFNATDPDGRLVRFELLDNGKVSSTRTNVSTTDTSFVIAWTNRVSGVHELVVRATDDRGATVTSAPVRVTAIVPNLPPVVQLAQFPGTTTGPTVTGPTNLVLRATVTDPDRDAIRVVEFMVNGKLAGAVERGSLEQYSLALPNIQPGVYVIYAKTTDERGATGYSNTQTLVVLPANGTGQVRATILQPATQTTIQTSSVTVVAQVSGLRADPARVELLVNDRVAARFPTATNNNALRLSLTNLAQGSYNLTVRATLSGGVEIYSPSVSLLVILPSQPPLVRLTTPTNGATYTAGANITLSATAEGRPAAVNAVQFYSTPVDKPDQRKLLKNDDHAPYNVVWREVPAGAYLLTVEATDASGRKAVSEPVKITVGAANLAPSVVIVTPRAGTQFELGARIPVIVEAIDRDGHPTLCELFAGERKIGSQVLNFIQAPKPGGEYRFEFAWTNATAGSHSLTARVTDDRGLVAASPAVKISVADKPLNLPPKVDITAPGSGTKFLRGSPITIKVDAADANGYITRVEVYAGDRRVALEERHYLVAPKPGEIAHFSLTWAEAPAGTHKLTAKAFDNAGLSSVSGPVTIEVVAEARTVVTVTTTTPEIQESRPQNPGQFKIFRTGPTATKLNIRYTLGGPAVNGVDYESLTGLAVIPAGESSVLVKVTPIPDKAIEGKESVILTVSQAMVSQPGSPEIDYLAGEPKSATITIYEDADVPVGTMSKVTVAASTQVVDPAGDGVGAFTITRTAPFDVDLVVLYTVEGTAVAGVDYVKLPGTVVIPKGAASAPVTVKPLPASLGKAFSTVLLTVQTPACPKIFPPPPECYLAGDRDRATVYILTLPVPPGPPVEAAEVERASTGAPLLATLMAAETDDDTGATELLFFGQVGVYYVIEAMDENHGGWGVAGVAFSGEGWFVVPVGNLKDSSPAEFRARPLVL